MQKTLDQLRLKARTTEGGREALKKYRERQAKKEQGKGTQSPKPLNNSYIHGLLEGEVKRRNKEMKNRRWRSYPWKASKQRNDPLRSPAWRNISLETHGPYGKKLAHAHLLKALRSQKKPNLPGSRAYDVRKRLHMSMDPEGESLMEFMTQRQKEKMKQNPKIHPEDRKKPRKPDVHPLDDRRLMPKPRKRIMHTEDFQTDFSTDIRQLFAENADLSEEFMTNAAALFESAVASKVADLRENMEVEAAEAMSEFLENYLDDMVEDLDNYLTYMAEQVVEQATETATNEENVAEVVEDLTSTIDQLAEDHDAQTHLHDTLMQQINDLEAHAAETAQYVQQMEEALASSAKKNIVLESAFDLTMADTEKLLVLVEDIEFDDPEAFADKVQTIKQTVFAVTPPDTMLTSDAMDDMQPLSEEVSPTIEAYAKMLSR